VLQHLKRFQTPTNQVFFLVSYGYFLATHRFFAPHQFREADLHYVAKSLGWSVEQIAPSTYVKQTFVRHRRVIRTSCQFRVWNQAVRQLLEKDALNLAQLYWEPCAMFLRLVDWLVAAHVTVPSSDVLGPVRLSV
jgi:hypothetical protein